MCYSLSNLEIIKVPLTLIDIRNLSCFTFPFIVINHNVSKDVRCIYSKPFFNYFQGVRNQGLVAQNVRKIVRCYECHKPRCVYSKKSLTVRESRAFERLLTKYDYCCGSVITPEGLLLI